MTVDQLKKLKQKKYRQESGFFLAEGEHLVLELLKAAERNPALKSCELFMTEKYQEMNCPYPQHYLTSRQMSQISDTKTPQGIFAIVAQEELLKSLQSQASKREKPRSVYLYQIQDPGNLGTILRSLAWFGDFQCLLSPDSVDPFNSKVVRASMGAIFHVPLRLDVSLAQLKSEHQRIALLDMQGTPLTDPGFQQLDCLLFGNEARGVPADELADLPVQRFTIAGCGSIDSLNLASALTLCAYELNR
ncbi:MAG: RNA methyltransferase [Pseudomonadales bacterium]|nr:RNA methyltransferase [Pseudomonadales bacterium]